MLIMPMGPGTYGSKKGRPKKKQPSGTAFAKGGTSKVKGQLKLNMKKMPPQVQKRLMQAMRKKK